MDIDQINEIKKTDPKEVAKLFFKLSVEDKDQDSWKNLLSNSFFDIFKDKSGNVTQKKMRGAGTSNWRMLTDGRTFEYEDCKEDEDDKKVYTFTYKKGDSKKEGLPQVVIKEDDEWRMSKTRLF